VRAGQVFRARAAEVESAARHAGARVHFDIHRDHGVDSAVNVTLRYGARRSHHRGRFGTLAGARHADTKGAAPFARPHPDLGLSLESHPLELASSWAGCVAEGEVDRAMLFYAPDAVVHEGGQALSGHRHLQVYLETSPLTGNRREPEIRGVDGDVLVHWEDAGPDQPGGDVRCRLEHGQIIEQWIDEAAPPAPSVMIEGAAGPIAANVVIRGVVPDDAVSYATAKLTGLSQLVDEPILFSRLKLTQVADPARKRPAIAEVALDINGELVRAHVASHSMREAIDLLEARLQDKLEHRAEHRVTKRRLVAVPEPGEWRHGDLPTERPEYLDRPVDERQLVRHKTFAPPELTADEAVFDMGQLDYDFYLFRDLASGTDCAMERRPDGSYEMTYARYPAIETGPPAVAVDVAPFGAPELTAGQAIERLDAGGEPFVFFVNAQTERGNIVYRRYDGHYGLIALA